VLSSRHVNLGQPRKRIIMKENVKISDCDFYHTMTTPDGTHVEGPWDLRDGVDDYLGHVDFAGKRVLEIGPASGFLSFHMEARGASVTSVEPPMGSFWDLVPRADMDMSAAKESFASHIRRIRNGFVFLRNALGSKVDLVEEDTYNLPASIGNFDVGLISCVLLHCKSPVQLIGSTANRVRDTMIICDLYDPSISQDSLCRLIPSIDNKRFDTWWMVSPRFVASYLAVLGFTKWIQTNHKQSLQGTMVELFTIVARRPRD
jgi:O-methyltransferase